MLTINDQFGAALVEEVRLNTVNTKPHESSTAPVINKSTITIAIVLQHLSRWAQRHLQT